MLDLLTFGSCTTNVLGVRVRAILLFIVQNKSFGAGLFRHHDHLIQRKEFCGLFYSGQLHPGNQTLCTLTLFFSSGFQLTSSWSLSLFTSGTEVFAGNALQSKSKCSFTRRGESSEQKYCMFCSMLDKIVAEFLLWGN